MDMLISALTQFAESSKISAASLSIIIIMLMSFSYRYLFNPMFERIKKLPDSEEMKKIINYQHDKYVEQINVVIDRLEHIESKLSIIDDLENINDVHMKDLKRDIESVKTILNQFQGHMMYGRRTGDFGNQELK